MSGPLICSVTRLSSLYENTPSSLSTLCEDPLIFVRFEIRRPMAVVHEDMMQSLLTSGTGPQIETQKRRVKVFELEGQPDTSSEIRDATHNRREEPESTSKSQEHLAKISPSPESGEVQDLEVGKASVDNEVVFVKTVPAVIQGHLGAFLAHPMGVGKTITYQGVIAAVSDTSAYIEPTLTILSNTFDFIRITDWRDVGNGTNAKTTKSYKYWEVEGVNLLQSAGARVRLAPQASGESDGRGLVVANSRSVVTNSGAIDTSMAKILREILGRQTRPPITVAAAGSPITNGLTDMTLVLSLLRNQMNGPRSVRQELGATSPDFIEFAKIACVKVFGCILRRPSSSTSRGHHIMDKKPVVTMNLECQIDDQFREPMDHLIATVGNTVVKRLQDARAVDSDGPSGSVKVKENTTSRMDSDIHIITKSKEIRQLELATHMSGFLQAWENTQGAQSLVVEDLLDSSDDDVSWRQTCQFFGHDETLVTRRPGHCRQFPDTKCKLRPHQLDDVQRVIEQVVADGHLGALLAPPMGVGKMITYQGVVAVRRLGPQARSPRR
ncbi:phosphoglycerate mutase [Colletotrichum sojae]|uniref:Phosphoglycerate mutase n=1 Tax=Colletotrichum sojae TaxID=2175907 RepID=A0A8H6MKR9_9PEZI|nr:phosphoglycerate mutase [Colletotrichum sojae]